MLVSTKAYAKTASSVPDVVACVVVNPVSYSEGHAVEEHITAEVLVSLGGHYHHAVVARLPGGKHDHAPLAVMKVDVVVACAGSVCAAISINKFYDRKILSKC